MIRTVLVRHFITITNRGCEIIHEEQGEASSDMSLHAKNKNSIMLWGGYE